MCAGGYLTCIRNRGICVLAGSRYLRVVLMNDNEEATSLECVLAGKNSVFNVQKCALAGKTPTQ